MVFFPNQERSFLKWPTKRTSSFAVMLLFLLNLSATVAAKETCESLSRETVVVGHIEEIYGPTEIRDGKIYGSPSVFELVRPNSGEKTISYGMSLKECDKIVVKIQKDNFFENDVYVKLMIENKVLTVKVNPNSYEIPLKKASSGLSITGLTDATKNWVSQLWGLDYQNRVGGYPKSQKLPEGGSVKPLSLQMLSKEGKEEVQLEADSKPRTLLLAWYGGTPPYQVQLTKISDSKTSETKMFEKPKKVERAKDECEKMEITEMEITALFATGEEYKLEVSDSSDPKVEKTGKFKVVSVPPIKETSGLSPHFLAAMIAAKENGKWRLEAYQKVAGKKDYSSCLVRQGLIMGSCPDCK